MSDGSKILDRAYRESVKAAFKTHLSIAAPDAATIASFTPDKETISQTIAGIKSQLDVEKSKIEQKIKTELKGLIEAYKNAITKLLTPAGRPSSPAPIELIIVLFGDTAIDTKGLAGDALQETYKVSDDVDDPLKNLLLFIQKHPKDFDASEHQESIASIMNILEACKAPPSPSPEHPHLFDFEPFYKEKENKPNSGEDAKVYAARLNDAKKEKHNDPDGFSGIGVDARQIKDSTDPTKIIGFEILNIDDGGIAEAAGLKPGMMIMLNKAMDLTEAENDIRNLEFKDIKEIKDGDLEALKSKAQERKADPDFYINNGTKYNLVKFDSIKTKFAEIDKQNANPHSK